MKFNLHHPTLESLWTQSKHMHYPASHLTSVNFDPIIYYKLDIISENNSIFKKRENTEIKVTK